MFFIADWLQYDVERIEDWALKMDRKIEGEDRKRRLTDLSVHFTPSYVYYFDLRRYSVLKRLLRLGHEPLIIETAYWSVREVVKEAKIASLTCSSTFSLLSRIFKPNHYRALFSEFRKIRPLLEEGLAKAKSRIMEERQREEEREREAFQKKLRVRRYPVFEKAYAKFKRGFPASRWAQFPTAKVMYNWPKINALSKLPGVLQKDVNGTEADPTENDFFAVLGQSEELQVSQADLLIKAHRLLWGKDRSSAVTDQALDLVTSVFSCGTLSLALST